LGILNFATPWIQELARACLGQSSEALAHVFLTRKRSQAFAEF
jgi:hypothetical protein